VTGALRELLDAERHGVLATASAGREGWPFASVVAFALTEAGEPLLLMSDLAEHTRNLRGDPRASLLVQDDMSRADPLAGARVTLLGRVEPISGAASVLATERYVARHPEAQGYLAMADFRLHVLWVSEARYIGGFGDMGWLAGDQLREALSR
jgi:heme iron utilization protein